MLKRKRQIEPLDTFHDLDFYNCYHKCLLNITRGDILATFGLGISCNSVLIYKGPYYVINILFHNVAQRC